MLLRKLNLDAHRFSICFVLGVCSFEFGLPRVFRLGAGDLGGAGERGSRGREASRMAMREFSFGEIVLVLVYPKQTSRGLLLLRRVLQLDTTTIENADHLLCFNI